MQKNSKVQRKVSLRQTHNTFTDAIDNMVSFSKASVFAGFTPVNVALKWKSSLSIFQWNNLKTVFFEIPHVCFPIIWFGVSFTTGGFILGKITKTIIAKTADHMGFYGKGTTHKSRFGETGISRHNCRKLIRPGIIGYKSSTSIIKFSRHLFIFTADLTGTLFRACLNFSFFYQLFGASFRSVFLFY